MRADRTRTPPERTELDLLTDDELQRMIDSAEALVGEIAAVTAVITLMDSDTDDEAADKARQVNWCDLALLAKRMEDHAGDVVHLALLPELRDRQRAAHDAGPRLAGGAR